MTEANAHYLPERVGVARIDGAATIVAEFGGRVVSLQEALDGDAPGSMVELIAAWGSVVPRLRDPSSLEELDGASLQWEAPVMPPKFLCVGANYTDHLAEMERAGGPKIDKTDFPFSFLKPPTNSLVGSGRSVAMPSYADELDWEAELVIVIGDPERADEDPLGAVFGYAILNELSLRNFVGPFPHPLGLDAVISKGFDGAAPMGPWITLASNVPDPTNLGIILRVNGEVKQDSSTAKMVFSVLELISYYARILTLERGDVIATGSPAGVGVGMQPPEFLKPGDQVEVEIDGLGTPLVTPIVEPFGSRSLKIG